MKQQLRLINMLGALGLGAGWMYFLDPDQGRRRARVRDQLFRACAQSGDLLDKAARDLRHRVWGSVAEAKHRFAQEQVDDATLVARVRSTLGRVTLRGPILAREVERLLTMVQSVHGVHAVDNQLDVNQRAGNIPGLQGEGRPRPGEVSELWQTHWTPAMRVLAGAAGGALTLTGLMKRGALGVATGLMGVGLLARAVTNLELKRLLGTGGGRRAVDIHKAMHIQAPLEDVYHFWANYENFPRFMTHIQEVRNLGEGRSHWIAAGPAGTSVAWDAELTAYEPNRLLAWRSTPGSMIENAGVIHFEANPDGSTRVHLRWSYNPPAGAVGHAVAWLLGRDLKTELDDDLVRLKSLLEQGKTRAASGTTVRREELEGTSTGETPAP